MKKIFNLVLIAMLTVGAASCSKDGLDTDQGGIVVPAGNSITFTIPSKSGIITYADPNTPGTVDALEAEKAIDGTSLEIYMFDATTKLLQAVITNPTMATVGSNKTATITLDNSWKDYTANKHFYLVANTLGNASALSGVVAKADLSAGATTLDDFLKLATDVSAAPFVQPANKKDAFLMMTEEALNVALATTTTKDVYFRRNVARFDIDNQVNTVGGNTGGNVTIKAVKVYNGNQNGYIFGYEQRDMAAPGILATATAGDLDPVTLAGTVDAGTGKQLEEGAFYIYPTVVGKEGNTKTIINLIGSVQGVDKVFTLKSATDVNIEANKRYKISAIDAQKLTFEIAVADWDEGSELVGEADKPGSKLVGVISSSDPDGWNGKSLSYDASQNGTTISFTASSSSSAGVRVETKVEVGDENEYSIGTVTLGTPVLTYGGASYNQTVSIELPKYTGSKSFRIELTVKDEKAEPNSWNYPWIEVYSDGEGLF